MDSGPDQTMRLLSAARGGDAEAVNRLLNRHRDALRRAIERRMDPRLRQRVDASDIVQEALLEANRRLTDYLRDPSLPFQSWLHRLANDRLIDAHRRHRVAKRRSLDAERPLEPVQPQDSLPGEAQVADAELTPAAAATHAELLRRFQGALESLEPADQRIVILRHFEQLSNQQAAELLSLSEQAASMRYLRAMRRLRTLLVDPGSTTRS